MQKQQATFVGATEEKETNFGIHVVDKRGFVFINNSFTNFIKFI
jgi:hypothetical protein